MVALNYQSVTQHNKECVGTSLLSKYCMQFNFGGLYFINFPFSGFGIFKSAVVLYIYIERPIFAGETFTDGYRSANTANIKPRIN